MDDNSLESVAEIIDHYGKKEYGRKFGHPETDVNSFLKRRVFPRHEFQRHQAILKSDGIRASGELWGQRPIDPEYLPVNGSDAMAPPA